MPESVESLRRATLEVVELATDSLEPDDVNPNEIDALKMAALRRDIVEGGFFQPVIVRPVNGGKRWKIIDGEHRWRILSEIGEKTTPCVIDDATVDDARLRMLTMNYLRGKPDPVRLARILSGLAKKLGEDELRARLGMDEDEYEAILALEGVGQDVDDALAARLEAEQRRRRCCGGSSGPVRPGHWSACWTSPQAPTPSPAPTP